MTGLLVSVRNAEEALRAIAGGADLIDVKEPLRGPLGPADEASWQCVQRAVAGRRPLSAALGELRSDAVASAARRAAGFQYAKIGLSGCRQQPHWWRGWAAAWRALPASVIPVAVVYADARAAAAPCGQAVLERAVEFGCGGLLVDTFRKDRGNLFSSLAAVELAALVAQARAARMLVVLGGSLDRHSLPAALQFAPDYVAVRGAVCRGGRDRAVATPRVRQLADTLRALGSQQRQANEIHRFA